MLTRFSLNESDPIDMVLGKLRERDLSVPHYGPTRAKPPIKPLYAPYANDPDFARYARTGEHSLTVPTKKANIVYTSTEIVAANDTRREIYTAAADAIKRVILYADKGVAFTLLGSFGVSKLSMLSTVDLAKLKDEADEFVKNIIRGRTGAKPVAKQWDYYESFNSQTLPHSKRVAFDEYVHRSNVIQFHVRMVQGVSSYATLFLQNQLSGVQVEYRKTAYTGAGAFASVESRTAAVQQLLLDTFGKSLSVVNEVARFRGC